MGAVKHVCVVGAGHVGAPHAAVLAQKCPDIKVTVCDHDERKVAQWNSSLLPFYEPSMQEVIEDVRGVNLFFSTDFAAAIKAADMIMVSVSTPLKTEGTGAGYAPNLMCVERVARLIAEAADGPKIIVERSTVPVKSADIIKRVLKFNNAHPMVVLSNPEFARQGSAMIDQSSPDRIMVGGEDSAEANAATAALVEIYARWVPRERIITSGLWSAELSKLTANAFLAQRISSINAISALCERTGADVDEVSFAVGVDSRIGRKYLTASVGFGGACYETHIRNLIYLCRSFRLPQVADYWQHVLTLNDYQKRRFASTVVASMFNTVSGKKLAVWGVAYKKNTDDTRDSPAFDVCKALLNERAQLSIYDPRVSSEATALGLCLADGQETLVECVTDAYDAAKGAHAILVLTEWDEFARLDFVRIFAQMEKPAFVFDGRNMLDHAALRAIGFSVVGIGKPGAPSPAAAPAAAKKKIDAIGAVGSLSQLHSFGD